MNRSQIGAYLRYVSLWCSKRRPQFLDTTVGGDGGELLAVLVIPVVNEVFGHLTPGSGFAQLLGRPAISGRGSDGSMNHATRLQFYDDKDVQWTKEQVKDDGEITSPDVASVILQEGGPCLT